MAASAYFSSWQHFQKVSGVHLPLQSLLSYLSSDLYHYLHFCHSFHSCLQFSSVQLLSHAWLFATPWIATGQAFLSITNSWSLLKLLFVKLVMPSHLFSSPSPPAPNPSQHQGLFQWVNSSHEEAKVLEFQLQHQSFQWTPRTDLF